jgi:hypothetical protein
MSELEEHNVKPDQRHLQDILDCAAEARAEGFHHLAHAFDELYRLAVAAESFCKKTYR